MSWVFLTDRFACKPKKPVRLDSLDHTPLECRRACCEAEVALNRRLAPEAHLGAVPLARGADAGLRLGTEGAVVEWLGKMRRLGDADRALLCDPAFALADAGPGRLLDRLRI